MARSSTPARITMPVRVFFSHSQSSSPITSAMPRMIRRVSVYWIPSTRRFTNLSKLRGQAMSSATPPKWASIWSARMIAIAIVISAWRRSWPWFQRRKTCCIVTPDRRDDDRRDDRRDDPVRQVDLRARQAEAAALADHVALQLQRDVAAEQEERAVRHVDDAHQAEDQREAARDDEVERGGGDPVQHRDPEVLGVVHGRAEGRRPLARRRREEQDPERGTTTTTASSVQPSTCRMRRRSASWRARLEIGARALERGLGHARLRSRYSTACSDSAVCGTRSTSLVRAG